MQVKIAPNVVSNTLPNTTQYSIKASAKAFKILSDGLYSDKIRAPIRELSCNAYDAHVAKGNADVPFDVHLPSVAEPWFSIRDYGIGMSKEELSTTYTTYFDSNKTHSNDFVGCMGLGSKTPFCVSDSFAVTSVRDGKKTTVINYLDQDVPNFSIISEEDTDEESGTEVKFTPSDSTDYSLLRESAQEVLGYFDVVPNLTIGATSEEVEVPTKVLEGTGWSYVDRNLGDSESVILMGNVAYPFSFHDITDGLEQRHGWNKSYEYRKLIDKVVFRVPIGDLDITASREEIGWTTEGREYMVNFVERVYNEIKDIMNDQLNACDTFYKARLMFNKMIGTSEVYSHDMDYERNGSIGHFDWSEQLTWKDNTLSERFGDSEKNPYLKKLSYNLHWLGYPKRNRYRNDDKVNRRSSAFSQLVFDTNVEFFENDLTMGGIGRINNYLHKNPTKVVLVFDEYNKGVKKYLKLIGYVLSINKTSDLEKPIVNRSGSTKSKGITIGNELSGDSWWYDARSNWDVDEELALNSKKTIYYVPIKNWKISHEGNEYTNRDLRGTLSKILGTEYADVTIHGIKVAQTKRLHKYPNFKNVFDVICNYVENSFKKKTGVLHTVVTSKKFEHFKRDSSYKIVSHLLKSRTFTKVCALLKQSGNDVLIKELVKIRRIVRINKVASATITDKEEQLIDELQCFCRNVRQGRLNLMKYFDSKVSYELKNVHKRLSEDYPMVRFMSGALTGEGGYRNSSKELVTYMELVNSSNK